MDKWFFPMKTVPQQGLGCALACVATIAGVTFDEAKKAAFPRDWRSRGCPSWAMPRIARGGPRR